MNQRKIELHEEQQYVIAYVEPIVRINGSYYLSGYVMHCNGRFVEMHLNLGPDLEYWDFEDTPPIGAKGILVWEGVCANALHYLHGADCDPEFVGKWRNPELTDLQLVIGNIGAATPCTPDPERPIDSYNATAGNP